MQSMRHLASFYAKGQPVRLLQATRLQICGLQQNLSGERRYKSDDAKSEPKTDADLRGFYYPNTDVGIKERSIKGDPVNPIQKPIPPYPDGKNPKTGEVGGPGGPEPTRFGDWERKGRVTDF